jgi:hypothetical protein
MHDISRALSSTCGRSVNEFACLRREMKNAINIIVTCTNRKTQAPLPQFHLGNVTGNSIEKRARNWVGILSSSDTCCIPASELYCGEHWSVVQSLPKAAERSKLTARIWICSAGYGLIVPHSPVSAYSATFATNDKDSVTRTFPPGIRRVAAQRWWRTVAGWSGPEGTECRTLTSVAKNYPRDALFVVASYDYLHALAEDLAGAARALVDPRLLLIVSAGTKDLGNLTDHLLPCDARLQSHLGGTRIALNVRIAKMLLESGDPRSWPNRLRQLLDKQTQIEQQRRTAMTDEQIRRFIGYELRKNDSISRSFLLRKLRDSGSACEQSRFANLYEEMVRHETTA